MHTSDERLFKIMRISINQLALMLIVFVTTACTPSLASPANPINPSASSLPSLPDLIVKFIYVEMQGRQGNCVEAYTPYEIRVVVENIGLASAGPFVVDLNGTQQQVDEGLANGQVILLHFAGIVAEWPVCGVCRCDQSSSRTPGR